MDVTPVANIPAPRHTFIRLKRCENREYFEYRGVSAVNSAFRDMQHRSDDIRELVARPLPLPALATLDAMLQEDLRKLAVLEVRVDVPEGDPDTVQTIRALNLNLPPSRLPELSSLVLLNSAAHLSAPLASHLHRLKMINPPGCANTLPLLPFIHCLHYLDHLTDLAVHNCFAPASDAEDPAGCPPVVGLLDWVTIEDYPLNISHMLSAFILRPSTSTSLIGNLRGASAEQVHAAFTTMLPRDRNCLPVLQKLTHLTVRCSSDFARIVGKVAEYPGHLSLEVITDVPDTPTEADRKSRGALYESMVRRLGDLFPGAPIEDLDFCGDNDFIPRTTWAAALDCFPRVRKMEIDVYDIAARGPLDEFFSALTKASWLRPKDPLLCQQLDDLTLYGTAGTAPATELWEAMKRCFRVRKERLGAKCVALRRLWVNLYGGECISNVEKALCKDMFYGLAEQRTIVEVYTEEHDINNLIIIYDPWLANCSIQ
ncbi:hypothetical protein TRAPUB_4986 [Trametes pubescens]|uniref:F-box domain-containing protein n=1 Tax=Trametes pubescens TaxID=154538 RepID=A0A1M2V9Y0_TRAPU|nr:hypothetical protein TRAPUB_4986 [Trametes pubescens]